MWPGLLQKFYLFTDSGFVFYIVHVERLDENVKEYRCWLADETVFISYLSNSVP